MPESPDHYELFGTQMAELLRTAEQMAEQAVADAERRARQLVDEASARASGILQDARAHADSLIAEAEAQSERLLAETTEQVNRLKRTEEQLRTGLSDAAHWLMDALDEPLRIQGAAGENAS